MGASSRISPALDKIESIHSPGRLREIASEWDYLCRRCPTATPFQSPAWLIPWYEHLGGGEMRVLAFWIGGELAGIAPLEQRYQETTPRLVLAGEGVTDYLDVLLDPAFASECLGALEDYLSSEMRGGVTCDFHELRSESPLLRLRPGPGLCREVSGEQICPVLPLPGAVEQLGSQVPPPMLARFDAARKRLHRRGRTELASADENDLDKAYETFLRLHEARWKLRDQPGVLGSPNVRAFQRAVTRELRQARLLRLYQLRLEGQPIATLYGLNDGQRFYFYLGGFDPAFATFSPGMVILGEAIQAATREGAREFDFLRGREAYKYHWGARDRILHRLRIRPEPDDTPGNPGSNEGT